MKGSHTFTTCTGWVGIPPSGREPPGKIQ